VASGHSRPRRHRPFDREDSGEHRSALIPSTEGSPAGGDSEAAFFFWALPPCVVISAEAPRKSHVVDAGLKLVRRERLGRTSLVFLRGFCPLFPPPPPPPPRRLFVEKPFYLSKVGRFRRSAPLPGRPFTNFLFPLWMSFLPLSFFGFVCPPLTTSGFFCDAVPFFTR